MEMNSVAAAFYAAAERSDEARTLIRDHESRETVRRAKAQQAAWWRWRNNQQPTKA